MIPILGFQHLLYYVLCILGWPVAGAMYAQVMRLPLHLCGMKVRFGGMKQGLGVPGNFLWPSCGQCARLEQVRAVSILGQDYCFQGEIHWTESQS